MKEVAVQLAVQLPQRQIIRERQNYSGVGMFERVKVTVSSLRDESGALDAKLQDASSPATQTDNVNVSTTALPRELQPFRVLMYGVKHTKSFWGQTFLPGQLELAKKCSKRPGWRSCDWFADPDIPDNLDSFVVMAGNPRDSPRLRQELVQLYQKRYRKKAKHFGQFYTEAFPQSQPEDFQYSVSIVGKPQVRLTEGCSVYRRTIAKLKSGELNLSATFDRPKGAASFVSNCVQQRVNFLKDVGKLYPIDHRGACLTNVNVPKNSSRQGNFVHTKELHARDYKFLFALENKQFEYYISEKVFNGLASGSIPIYYGAALKEVSEFLPLNSFIYIPKFSRETAKGLADYMHHLQENRTLFESYLKWGLADLEALLQRHCQRTWPCKVCDYLNMVDPAFPSTLKTPQLPRSR
eukprot:1097512-Rhodomonas_salina.1